ncbi:hypothetical protein [Halobacillus salinus]|uniref:hypothetical protein n=1 Tax=Halobacillus salinus TaxID=192814 RepID=UPI00349FA654
MPVQELIVRLLITFVTLLALTPIMGRKEISQMTFFNFVSAISIGTIGASLAINQHSVYVMALLPFSLGQPLLFWLD